MALNTNGDIITEVLVRNNITTTDAFVTDTILQGWLKDAHIWAMSYKKWPFTESRISTTFAGGGGLGGDEWYFEGYKADSIRMIQIGGKRLLKLNFQDYLIFREEESTGNDRVFSDFGRVVFINPYLDSSGTLVAYGQFQPVLDVTDLSAQTGFSSWDEEGNEAIVEKMTGYLKRRLHEAGEAELYDKRASTKLDEIYKRVEDEQYAYQTHPDSQGMFKRIDVVKGRGGGQSDPINNINQFI